MHKARAARQQRPREGVECGKSGIRASSGAVVRAAVPSLHFVVAVGAVLVSVLSHVFLASLDVAARKDRRPLSSAPPSSLPRPGFASFEASTVALFASTAFPQTKERREGHRHGEPFLLMEMAKRMQRQQQGVGCVPMANSRRAETQKRSIKEQHAPATRRRCGQIRYRVRGEQSEESRERERKQKRKIIQPRRAENGGKRTISSRRGIASCR
jgi:hypothetical protein